MQLKGITLIDPNCKSFDFVGRLMGRKTFPGKVESGKCWKQNQMKWIFFLEIILFLLKSC